MNGLMQSGNVAVLPAEPALFELRARPDWQMVHRSLVHKKASEQVILRRVRRRSEDVLEFQVSGIRGQMLSMLTDASFVAEALRQSTIASAHLLHSTAKDWAFIMDRMVFDLDVHSIRSHPPDTLRIRARDVTKRAGALSSLTSEMTLLSGRTRVASGEGYLRVIAANVYARLRSNATRRDSAPASHRKAEPIVLTPVAADASERSRWSVDVDDSDPLFFDHAVDHLPGMVIFEAACIGAAEASVVPNPRIQHFDGRFYRYVELDERLELVIATKEVDGEGEHVLVHAVTGTDAFAMTATVDVAPTRACLPENCPG